MTIFLNLALLIIGTAATLAAFGGKTWREGKEPILERITPRGWVSLMCLVLALALGVIKEIRSEAEDSKKEQDAHLAKLEADKKQAELAAQFTDSQLQLKLANKGVDNLILNAKDAQERLKETKATLNDVRGNLKSTGEDLSRESTASLITSLASSDRKVRDIWLYIPLAPKANLSLSFREALLPAFNSPKCRDLVDVQVALMTSSDHIERIYYEPGDNDSEHQYLTDSLPKIDTMLPIGVVEAEVANGFENVIDKRLTNGVVYTAVYHTLNHSISAAQLYAGFAGSKANPVLIAATWPRTFKTKEAYLSALKIYPDILKADSGEVIPESHIDLRQKREYRFPASCAKQIDSYFREAFKRAVIVVILDGKQNQTILFRLKGTVDRIAPDEIVVSFVPASLPEFNAANDSKFTKESTIWPDPSTKFTPATRP
jgi:hypothetical protein